jgi:hypothetical protein
LTLRGLSAALADAARAQELADATGMTKEQLEQAARAYERPQIGPGREAKEVEVTVGAQPAARPGSNLHGAGVRTFDRDKIRSDRAIPLDAARGNIEGDRDAAPREFRDRVADYKNRLARIGTTRRPAAGPRPAGPE